MRNISMAIIIVASLAGAVILAISHSSQIVLVAGTVVVSRGHKSMSDCHDAIPVGAKPGEYMCVSIGR